MAGSTVRSLEDGGGVTAPGTAPDGVDGPAGDKVADPSGDGVAVGSLKDGLADVAAGVGVVGDVGWQALRATMASAPLSRDTTGERRDMGTSWLDCGESRQIFPHPRGIR